MENDCVDYPAVWQIAQAVGNLSRDQAGWPYSLVSMPSTPPVSIGLGVYHYRQLERRYDYRLAKFCSIRCHVSITYILLRFGGVHYATLAQEQELGRSPREMGL